MGKISEMPNASALAGDEQIPGVQSAANVKLTPAQIETYLSLGDAAKKNTGTTTGTVAAGDHNHSGVYEEAGAVSTHESSYSHGNLPTSDQKAALAGTGTPSSSNKYVTEDGIPDPTKLAGINAQTGTTYTLVLADAGKRVRCSNASPIALTIPLNSSVAFATNTFIEIEQQGAGVVTVAGASGVTVNGAKKSWGQYSTIRLLKLDTDLWTVDGGSE